MAFEQLMAEAAAKKGKDEKKGGAHGHGHKKDEKKDEKKGNVQGHDGLDGVGGT